MDIETAIKIFIARGWDDRGVFQAQEWSTACKIISDKFEDGYILVKPEEDDLK